MLERHVEKGRSCLGKDVTAVGELPVDVQPASSLAHEARADEELGVDRNGMPVADEDPGGNGREAVPGGEEAARLVEGGCDEPAVYESRPGLMCSSNENQASYSVSPSDGGCARRIPAGALPQPQHAGSWRGGITRLPPTRSRTCRIGAPGRR